MSRREPYEFDAPKDGAQIFWKSLEDKKNPEAAQKRAESEFPLGLPESKLVKLRKKADGNEEVAVGRRGFMMFAGASAALMAEGCARRPVEKIMPYAKAPEHVLPGVSQHFASVHVTGGDAVGILVESHEGRPSKVEGNPDHPASLGATDAFAQASIHELYDPDRSTTPLRRAGGSGHQPATWQDVDSSLADLVRTATADQGARLRILYAPSTSPSFARIRAAVQAKLPQAKFHVWSAVNEQNAREGAQVAFGQPVNAIPNYAKAKVVVALDSDFLHGEPGNLVAARRFMEGRKLDSAQTAVMNRLYVVEPAFTVTGMNADHRLRLPAQDIERYLFALAKELGAKHGVELGTVKNAVAQAKSDGIPPKWIEVVAKELAGNRAAGILVAGSRQPGRVHALVHAINAALGNAGHTVDYYPTAEASEQDPAASIKQLTTDMKSGAVATLLILGGNPVYDAPADVSFADALKKVGNSVHLSLLVNETSDACAWHIPCAHELEAWGDARSLDGTVAIQQPLIAPLFNGRSDLEVLARFAGDAAPKGHAIVQQTARGGAGPSTPAFHRQWSEALKRGVLGNAAQAYGNLGENVRLTEVATALGNAKAPAALSPQNLEVTFAPCPRVFDGRYANNQVLLELPDPITKVCWDNVGLISAATAKALNAQTGSVLRLTRDGAGTVDIAVFVMPGQADNTIGLTLGWGRQKAGRYGDKRGFDVNPLRTTDALGFANNVKPRLLDAGELEAIKTRYRKVGMAAGDSPVAGRVRPDDPFEVETNLYKLSQTQEHNSMEGRPVAIDGTLAQYKAQPAFPMFPDHDRKERRENRNIDAVREVGSPDPKVTPLWDSVKYENVLKWGMTVDLSACTGCAACVVACQVENNIPSVGKEQVWRGREMHWLRIDRYFVGLDEDNPEIAFQPVACVQCEEAPCENVCPVNATAHSPEGLNDMAYNRCIGTRYCANNCPYKVRRFNFLNYHTSGGSYEEVPEIEKMHYNPNVTVRMRGVMEKCTYCVQRIQEAKIKSKRDGKPVKDGAVVTACQQVCPTQAIKFGDLNDPTSKVAKARATDRAYRLLAELGTHPRTSYLGKVRNPNPDMNEKA